DWVKSLTRSSSTHHNAFASKRATMVGLMDNILSLFPNTFRVRQATSTSIATGQPAHGWFDDMDTTGTQGLHIGLRCGVSPHFSMHCRCHNHRDRGSKQDITD